MRQFLKTETDPNEIHLKFIGAQLERQQRQCCENSFQIGAGIILPRNAFRQVPIQLLTCLLHEHNILEDEEKLAIYYRPVQDRQRC